MKDIQVAAWKFFGSTIIHHYSDFRSATDTLDSDVSFFDSKVSALTQLHQLANDPAIVPSGSRGSPANGDQIIMKSILLQVHWDDSITQVTWNC